MKIEVEARLLEVDVKKFLKVLKENNAEFVGDWLQMRYCYDFTPVNENSWIRLRTNGKETTLTIKDVSSDKIDGTKELEIIVSDFAETDAILNKMGYIARSKQENRRIRYMLDGVEIDIDFWPMIPAYVEFEAENEEDIVKVCKKLNVDFNELVTIGNEKIYKQYGITLKDYPIIELEEFRKM